MERCDAVLGRGNLMLSTTRGELIAYDSFGKEFFRAALTDRGRMQVPDPSQIYGVSHGNLLIVSLGGQIVAFDTLGAGKSGTAQALWRKDVSSTLNARYPHSRINVGPRISRPGTFRASRSQINGKWIGVIGPLTHNSCIFQDQRRLICVDSRTGEERWSRSDVPTGCDLYGDEQYVIVVPRDSKIAFAYSTIDGRNVGKYTVPLWQEQLATVGRNVIRWRKRADGRQELSSYDSVAEESVWQQDFGKNARVDIAMGRYVAVVDHSGACVVVDAIDGTRLVDQILPLKPRATDVHLLAGSESFVLAVQSQISGQRQTAGKPVRRELTRVDYVMLNGSIYVFDRQTGQPVWKRPAEVSRQPLMLTQPVDAPVIAFVGIMPRRDNQGSHQAISMLILEKASGRRLFSDDALPASRANHCAVKALGSDSKEVLVETSSQSIRLAFSDRQRSPEPPVMLGLESQEKKEKKGLRKIGEKLIGGG